jgi:hypothetical protein
VASCIASCVLHSPPAPLNVGSPELALKPAPNNASILVDLFKCSWKLSRSLCGTTLARAAEEAILRATCGSDRMAVVRYKQSSDSYMPVSRRLPMAIHSSNPKGGRHACAVRFRQHWLGSWGKWRADTSVHVTQALSISSGTHFPAIYSFRPPYQKSTPDSTRDI